MHIKLAVICIEMKLYSFMFTDNQTEGVVYNENNKGPRIEPRGMPNRSLHRTNFLLTDNGLLGKK